MHNATRYATEGTTITVLIEDDKPPDCVRIAAQDTGAQIPPDDLPRIFDRFYRANKSRLGSGTNHGLGLAIVAAISRMHDGSTFATSDDGTTMIGLVLARQTSHAVELPPSKI